MGDERELKTKAVKGAAPEPAVMAGERRGSKLLLSLLLLLLHVAGTLAQANRCDAPMGLEDGTIPDANITSSVNGSFPERARLQGKGAWCFTVSGGALITLTVDLGITRLVSGVKVQGPPASLYPANYHYAIGFWILNSSVAAVGPWGSCCGDKFYARDEYDEAEVVQVHPLGSLVLARFLRLQFRTDVLSFGNDTKCLRLEILGCPADVQPDSGVLATAEQSGWVVVSWQPPVIQLPQVDASLVNFTLASTDYQVGVSRTGGGEKDMRWEANVKALRYLLPTALWGATYSVTLVCVHQGRPLTCGVSSVTAVFDSCDGCLKEGQVVFRGPTVVRACVVDEGVVELTWTMDTSGWVTRNLDLRLVARNGVQLDQQNLTSRDVSARVAGVSADSSYIVSFCPVADSKKLAEFSFDLHLISWENVEDAPQSSGYGAFLSDVSLSADVQWNGTLKLTWLTAQVCGMALRDLAQTTVATTTPQPRQTTVTQTTRPDQTTVAETTQPGQSTSVPPATNTPTTATATLTTQTSRATDNDATTTTEAPPLATDTLPSDSPFLTTQPTTLPPAPPSLAPALPSLSPDSPTPATEAATLAPLRGTVKAAVTYTLNITYGDEVSSEEVQQGEGSALGEPVMRVYMTQLSFQTLYTARLICNFGKVSLECGTSSTFTELPLHILRLEGRDIVHVAPGGRAGWVQQEARCKRGDGNLVSLSTLREETLLVSTLTRDPSKRPSSFWLGLNLCQTYKGRTWSDGSIWRHSRLYNRDTQLSSTTCCIKATWNVDQYSWFGEVCDALHPAICEYRPNGLTGQVTTIEPGEANTTQASITWTYEPNFWMPTAFTISYCPFRKLENILTDPGNVSDACLRSDVDVETREHQQSDLEPFTEYQVTVAPSFMPLNYTSGAAVTFVRTYPETPLLVKVDSAGFVNVMFALKVSEFGDQEEVSVRLATTDPYSVVAQRNVNASGVRLGGIQIGVNYTVSVREMTPTRRREALSLLAYPPCACEGCQVDVWCYVSTDVQTSIKQGERDCQQKGASMVTVTSFKEAQQLLQMATDAGDDLWVRASSARIQNAGDSFEGTTLTDADWVTINTTTSQDASVCLVMSRAMQGVLEEDCANVHKSACSYRAPVGQAFPSIKTEVDSSSASVTWNTSAFGWVPQQMSVTYKKTGERDLRWMPVTSQPAVINDLQQDTAYTLVFEADLGSGVLATSGEFQISTTNDTGKMVSPLILGMSPVLQYQVLQLVCNSLLVASCILTMLFFFATGMFYQDCVAQLGFESTLMVAYLVLMIAYPTSAQTNSQTGCIVVAVVLHFLFLCAFTFLMLEALTLAHLLVVYIKSPFQKSNWMMVVAGVAAPLLVVAFTAGFGHQQYADFNIGNCWLNPMGSAMWGEVVPIGLLVAATVFLLANTFCTQQTPPVLVEEDHRGRQSDSHKLRWVVLALCLELLVAWGTGVAGYQSGDQATYTFFCVMTLVLAITIAGARTSFDDTFRNKMHRLCCGTELTYKRSDLLSISARSRITPTRDKEEVSRMITPVGSHLGHCVPAGSRASTPAGTVSSRMERTPADERTRSALERLTPSEATSTPQEGRVTSPVGMTVFTVSSSTPPLCPRTPAPESPTSPVATAEEVSPGGSE